MGRGFYLANIKSQCEDEHWAGSEFNVDYNGVMFFSNFPLALFKIFPLHVNIFAFEFSLTHSTTFSYEVDLILDLCLEYHCPETDRMYPQRTNKYCVNVHALSSNKNPDDSRRFLLRDAATVCINMVHH
jgi:hypothetical protein